MSGSELRQELERLGLYPAAFARLVDTGPVTVNRWLCDRRKIPHWLPSWLRLYGLLSDRQRKAL